MFAWTACAYLKEEIDLDNLSAEDLAMVEKLKAEREAEKSS